MDDIEYIKLHIDDYTEEEGWIDSCGVEYSMDRKVLLSMREIDSSLTSYEIRNGTLAVASWIFYDSDFCGDIYIPKTVQYIDGGAFTHSGIQNVICSSDRYYIEGGLIIDSQSHFIVSAFNTSCVLELSNDIQGICHNAFTNNYSLKELIINNENFTIEADAFSDNDGLRSIQIKSKDLNIGEHAFEGVRNLKKVDIASEKLSIGKHAFRSCYKLENVRIFGDLQLLNIFRDCHSLQYLDLPSSIIEISDYCFSECKKLKSFILPENVQTIGKSAFENCESLTDIHFNNRLISINKRAFNNCSSINYLLFPESLESIEGSAFENCHNIRHLIFRGPTPNISSSAFWGCYRVHNIFLISPTYELIYNRSFEEIDHKKIIVNRKKLPSYSIEDNIVFADLSIEDLFDEKEPTISIGQSYFSFPDDSKVLYTFNKRKIISFAHDIIEYTIPYGTISLGDNMCESYSDSTCNLEKVDVPSSLTYIGFRAFEYCTKLVNINLPESITYIGGYAFTNCSLRKIEIPKNIKKIHNGTFLNCKFLEQVKLPENLLEIANSAFTNCESLETLNLPESLKTIGSHSLNSLKSVVIPKNVENIGKAAFKYDCQIINESPNFVISGDYLLSKDMSHIICVLSRTPKELPNSVTEIESIIFDDIYIKNLVIPESVQKIKSRAFEYCTGLSEIIIENPKIEIANDAFGSHPVVIKVPHGTLAYFITMLQPSSKLLLEEVK